MPVRMWVKGMKGMKGKEKIQISTDKSEPTDLLYISYEMPCSGLWKSCFRRGREVLPLEQGKGGAPSTLRLSTVGTWGLSVTTIVEEKELEKLLKSRLHEVDPGGGETPLRIIRWNPMK